MTTRATYERKRLARVVGSQYVMQATYTRYGADTRTAGIVEKPSGDGAELTRLLNDLRNSGIGDRAQRARPGREKQFFDTEMVVSRLARAIASTNEARPVIEAYLDSLFEDFQPGTLFEHSTIVMAILHALQRDNTQASPRSPTPSSNHPQQKSHPFDGLRLTYAANDIPGHIARRYADLANRIGHTNRHAYR